MMLGLTDGHTGAVGAQELDTYEGKPWASRGGDTLVLKLRLCR